MPTTVISNWSTLIEGFQIEPQEFYDHVRGAMEERRIPDITLSTITHKEGGAFSANRLYLRAQRGDYVFDICGAPFGTGFFTSWWLVEKRSRWGFLFLFLIVSVLGGIWFSLVTMMALIFDPPTTAIISLFLFPVYVLIGIPALFWFAGAGFFSNQEAIDDFFLDIPFVGALYHWVFKPITYYRRDIETMFQTAIHAAVLHAVDSVTKDKGIRALTELERRPRMKALAAKA